MKYLVPAVWSLLGRDVYWKIIWVRLGTGIVSGLAYNILVPKRIIKRKFADIILFSDMRHEEFTIPKHSAWCPLGNDLNQRDSFSVLACIRRSLVLDLVALDYHHLVKGEYIYLGNLMLV